MRGEHYLSARGLKAELEPAVKILYFIQNHLEIPSDGTGQTVDCVLDRFTRWRQNYQGREVYNKDGQMKAPI